MNDLFDDPLFSSMTSKDSQQTAAPSDWFGELRQAWVDFWSHAFDAARSTIESATQSVPELADFREAVTGVLSDLQDLISNFVPPSADQGVHGATGDLVDAQCLFGETQPLAPPSPLDWPPQSAPANDLLEALFGCDASCGFPAADHTDIGASLSNVITSYLNAGQSNNVG